MWGFRASDAREPASLCACLPTSDVAETTSHPRGQGTVSKARRCLQQVLPEYSMATAQATLPGVRRSLRAPCIPCLASCDFFSSIDVKTFSLCASQHPVSVGWERAHPPPTLPPPGRVSLGLCVQCPWLQFRVPCTDSVHSHTAAACHRAGPSRHRPQRSLSTGAFLFPPLASGMEPPSPPA